MEPYTILFRLPSAYLPPNRCPRSPLLGGPLIHQDTRNSSILSRTRSKSCVLRDAVSPLGLSGSWSDPALYYIFQVLFIHSGCYNRNPSYCSDGPIPDAGRSKRIPLCVFGRYLVISSTSVSTDIFSLYLQIHLYIRVSLRSIFPCTSQGIFPKEVDCLERKI